VTTDIELRTCTDDDFSAVSELVAGALLMQTDDEALASRRLVFEPARTHVAVEDDRIVASGGVFTREMTVPGTTLPVAHVTAVGVAPTHRRRGLLTALMTDLLSSVRSAGTEPVAALWASEGAIYGRYGYGLASWNVEYEVVTRETTVPGVTPPGRLRQVVPAEERKSMAEVLDRARGAYPGVSSRPGGWWERRTADVASRRGGWSAERAVLHSGEDGVDGYAMWRTKGGWGPSGPIGEVLVTEVVAETRSGYTALWRFLLSIDLVRTVRFAHAAVDEPLAHLLVNPGGAVRSTGPGLWVRLVDVPAALAARRYAAPLDVVIEVTDQMIPGNAGRWHLVGDRSSSYCEHTTAAPDLTMDVGGLASAYLGGVSLHSLFDAGLVGEHRPGCVATVSTAFGWDRAPRSWEIF
jgi:predicted acetyltransferase